MMAEYGVSVDVKEYTGFTDCPDCAYDDFYKTSSNPNCTTCSGRGKVKAYTSHVENIYALWLTEEELSKVPVGNIKVGDVKLTGRIETQPWFKNAIQNETRIAVEDITVIPKMIQPSALRTVVHVYCARTEID
jgi:hypothetical protein